MKSLLKASKRTFGALLKFYPSTFQEMFSEEMQQVFNQTIQNASRQGLWKCIKVIWLEVRDLPLLALYEYVSQPGIDQKKPQSEPYNRRIIMQEKTNKWTIDNPRQVLISILPPMLLGLGISLTWWIIGGPWFEAAESIRKIAIYVGLIPVIIIVLAGIYGLMKRLPKWSALWLGTNICGAALVCQSLIDENMELASNPAVIIIGILAAIGAIAIGIVISMRNWKHAGLLGIGLSSTICIFNAHLLSVGPLNRVEFGWLAVAAGFILSVLSYIFVRSEKTYTAITAFITIALLNTISIYGVSDIYSHLPGAGEQSFFIPLTIIAMVALGSGLMVQLAKYTYQKTFAK